MFNKVTRAWGCCCLSLFSYPLAATQILTYQQGSDNYSGATSTKFAGSRHQNSTRETHYFRFDQTSRIYNLEHFALDNLGEQADVESAKLVFYRVGGSIYTASDIYVRQILDPDNLGSQYATGWKVGSGFRGGANTESRDDTTSVDVKWQLSDPDFPDDLNADYFQGVLKSLDESPFFTPQFGDAIGTAYEVDVTGDVQCMQVNDCANQGWALFHSNNKANMQNITASSHYFDAQYRPQLVVSYADNMGGDGGGEPDPVPEDLDELEPLVIESYPYNEEITSTNNSIELSLLTNEVASCRFDLSPFDSFADMRFNMISVDGISHSGQWPNIALNVRFQLFGKCRDEAGNISQTPHVYTFTVSEDLASDSETYTAMDLLPGLQSDEVWQTLYAITDEDLTITLGDLLASDGGVYAYQVEGPVSCVNSLLNNQCTFNNSQVSTELLTVTYTRDDVSGIHQIVVVTQEKGINATTNYSQNKNVITPDYGPVAPVKGESRVDAVTGVTIYRLTDADEIEDSSDALIVYSRYSPESSGGDYILVFGGNSQSSRVINRKTGELVSILTDDNGATIGENHEIRWDTSGRHPNRIYYIQGMKFWMVDDIRFQTQSRLLLKDFSALFPNADKIYNDVEGDSSNDSDHWAWMAVHYGTRERGSDTYLVDAFIHYQISTDTVHSLKPADLAGTSLAREQDRATFTYRPNMVEMSPLGTGVVLHFDRKFDDSDYGGVGIHYISSWFDGPHLWPLDFDVQQQIPVKISLGASHSGWAFDQEQREMFISQNNRTDKLDAIYINGDNSGYEHRLAVASHGDFGWAMGFHYGKMPQNKPGWLFMNSYSKDNTLWGANQFMMIQTKPETENPIIWRIAPSYNKYDGEYRDEAPAAINLSGNRIYWSSNWGGFLDHREVFMIELPDNWEKEMLK